MWRFNEVWNSIHNKIGFFLGCVDLLCTLKIFDTCSRIWLLIIVGFELRKLKLIPVGLYY